MNKLGPSCRATMRLLIKGLSLKEAAARRGIAHVTAKNHVMRARRRLGLKTGWQLLYVLGREARGV